MTKIVKRSDGWWIVELPLSTPDCGPYDRLDGPNSAKEDLIGLERFFTEEVLTLDLSPKIQGCKVKVKRLT